MTGIHYLVQEIACQNKILVKIKFILLFKSALIKIHVQIVYPHGGFLTDAMHHHREAF